MKMCIDMCIEMCGGMCIETCVILIEEQSGELSTVPETWGGLKCLKVTIYACARAHVRTRARAHARTHADVTVGQEQGTVDAAC